MKNIILLMLCISIYSSCKKDNTVIPPTNTYAYDSLHRSIIGKWVYRYALGGVGKIDTYSFYTITYDSIYFSSCKNFSHNPCIEDTIKYVQFKNYKFIHPDTIQANFSGIDYKIKVKIFSKDSIVFYRLGYVATGQVYDIPLVR
jgi:hypothetical protein